MAELTVKREIAGELDRMPVELQRRVLACARDLAPCRPKGEPGKDLFRFAGWFDAETAREMAKAIESGCERIDPNEW